MSIPRTGDLASGDRRRRSNGYCGVMAADETPSENIVFGALELPEGTVVQHSIFAVAYFDAEGVERYGWSIEGGVGMNSVIGLMEMVKGHMFNEAFATGASDD